MGKTAIAIVFVLLWTSLIIHAAPEELLSPDGRFVFSFTFKADAGEQDGMYYSIRYAGKPVVLESRLGIQNFNDSWDRGLVLRTVERSTRDLTWNLPYGERSEVRDHCREAVFHLEQAKNENKKLDLVVRAYNQGIAFRYRFPELEKGGPYLHITGESTEFVLPKGTRSYFTPRAQTEYSLLPLKDWPGEAERPLTLILPDGTYACLAEAEMVNYVRTKFALHPQKEDTLLCSLYGPVDEIAPYASSWRVVMAAEEAGKLLQGNDLILNLNPPCAIADTSWIRPGKVMREITLSTAGARKLVDFAAAHQISYIHFDAGWYGYEYQIASDATRVNVDPLRNPKGGLDLEEAIRYARSKGIKVLLYVNQRALAAQLDTLLPLYEKWGVSGIKFGFVQVGSHRWSVWLHEAIQKCARHRLLVDIHDEYRPTGFSRTFPNLMTQEGIRGNEEMPDALQNTIIPFTRMIAGAADYTFCYYYRKEFGHPERYIKNTAAHQLALPVIYYSPLQWMYWYDKPDDYQGEPELEFWDAVPTVWEDTRVIHGLPGEFVTIARKSKEEWFVGTITGLESRRLSLPLSFLQEGKSYEASIYYDDPPTATRTHVAIRRQRVDSKTVLDIKLLPSGGQAIRIRPLTK